MDFLKIWMIAGLISLGLLWFAKKKRPGLLYNNIPFIDWRVDLIFNLLFFVLGIPIILFVVWYLITSNLWDLYKWIKKKVIGILK